MASSMEILFCVSLLGLLSSLETGVSLKIEVMNDSTIIRTYKDKSAILYSRSYMIYDPFHGELVYPIPRNACNTVDDVPQTSSLLAFVPEYDDCQDINAYNVYDAGYSLMISHSSSDSGLKSTYSVAQALVDKDFADYLIENVVNETNITVIVSEDYMILYERLLMIFGMVLLCAISLAVLIFFCTCCCRWGVRKWKNRGLTSWRIRQLPRRRYRKGRESSETCSICLEDFKDGEYTRILPCDHMFHPSCVDEWLKNWNRVCPLCKASISRSRSQQEREPLLNDLESSTTESPTRSYGSIRLSAATFSDDDDDEDHPRSTVQRPSNQTAVATNNASTGTDDSSSSSIMVAVENSSTVDAADHNGRTGNTEPV